jgi:uncharacterized SAM-binding protein YcdF (DUF218 family)
MAIFLSKFLPLFLYPAGLVTLLILLTLVTWKKRRLSLAFLIMAFVLLMVAGNRYTASALARSLEWKYPPLTTGTTGDVIVVLGGGTDPMVAPRQMVEANAASDRVLYGALLYKQETAPVILLSGGDIDFLDSAPSTPADDMATMLEFLGIPRADLVIQNQSMNTYEDAKFSCAILKERGYEKIILVTSAFHMPRSVALFQSQGCPVIPAPVDYGITEAGWQKLAHPTIQEIAINLLPSYTNISSVTKIMKEYFGMLYYRLSGIY